ncbi:MAG: DUF1302 domain-containing protein [Desulfuromusa sp.]|nr:DUF1302 domain-containing protein [Desulfuromusa sp.]
MKITTRRKFTGLSARGTCLTLLALVLAATFTVPAFAFQFGSGDLTGSLDSTLSYGLAWRLDDQDSDLIGIANGGDAYSVNYDDGNLNYDKGDLISNTAKITSEVALQYKNFGLFVRGTAFYDFENEDGDRARTDLSDDALDMVGKDIDLLDAYVSVDFDVAHMPAQIRVGNQVLSWGESTFIQNGINVINPFDVSKFRVAGAELKEGLIPVGMVSASISPTENITFEGFYQYDWQRVKIDAPGTYWSTNDFVGKGGDKVMLGWGEVSDQGTLPAEDTLLGVPRGSNVYADDSGQYGVAMRVYAPGLNDTEFGFYFMNYHSRLPVISSRTGDLSGLTAAGTISAVTPTIIGTVLADGGDPTNAIAAATPIIGAEAATAIAGSTAQAYAASGGDSATAIATGTTVATAYGTDAFAKTAEYIIEYPEDIKLYGVSFNTLLQKSGVALQGEVSYRTDVPLQLDDIELLLATMEPLIIAKTGGAIDTSSYSQFSDSITPTDIVNNGGESIYIQGYERYDVAQAQMTATKLFGPVFGASQFTFVTEVGVTHVYDMPSKDEMRLNGPGTPVSGNPDNADPANPIAAHPGIEEEPVKAFADATSWGYRMVAKLDFNNAIGAVTLSPRIAWAQDVIGTTPGPGGNFVDGRKTVTLGLGANYQNQWTADLSYTDYFGADRYNLVNDRDFVAFNVKYSF